MQNGGVMKHTTMMLFAGWIAMTGLNAQDNRNEIDPFAVDERPAALPAEGPAGRTLSVLHEEFSLDLPTAAELQRKNLGDAALYEVMLEMVSEKTAKQESLTLIRVISGNKGIAESISENIYPTEYEPAELPNTVGVSIVPARPSGGQGGQQAPQSVPDTDKLERAMDPSSLEGLRTPATGTAFETRNLGRTIEVEAFAELESGFILLRMNCDHVVLAGSSKYGQGVSEVTMPEFETRRLATTLELALGKPALAGTVSRTPESKVDADSANRIWFAFVTVDFVKP